MNSLSVVIPVYRARETLVELHRQLVAALVEITPVFEIIFVEDGGEDGSWSIIMDLVQKAPNVRGIRMSRNYGQHNAVLCGIRAARHDIIVTMDDDLQHPPGEIAALLTALESGYDVVYGVPFQEQHSFWRNIASRLIKLTLANAMGVQNARNVSAFRLFRTRLRDGFRDYGSPSVAIDVLLSWTTVRFGAVKVSHASRATGVSGYTLRKLTMLAIDQITGFSTLPLRIASGVGFAFMIFGMVILLYVVANYLVQSANGSEVPGFTFLASIISIFAGAQLFSLGIAGEYLARIYFRSMDRPTYLVAEIAQAYDPEHPDKQHLPSAQ